MPALAPAPAPTSPDRISHPEYRGGDNRFRIVIVDLEKNVRAQARQAAHERFNREAAEVAEKKGLKRAVQNIWRQGLAREYYEQKYVREATEDIYGDVEKVGKEGPNLVDNEAFGASTDLLDDEWRLQTNLRFAHDQAEQLIQEEAGESYKKVFALDEHGNPLPPSEVPEGAKDVQEFVVNLGEAYLFGSWSKPEDFEEHKRRKMKELAEHNPDARDLIGDGVVCTDNLTEVYKNVGDVLRHEIGLGMLADTLDAKRARAQELLNESQIVTGEAHVGAYGSERLTRVERITEKVSKVLPVNEATIAAAASIAIGVSAYAARRAVGLAGGGIPGLTGAITGGVVAGFREAKALKRERMYHEQAMAENKFAGQELTGRREKLESARYETKTAKELMDGISTFYDSTTGDLLLEHDETGTKLVGEDLNQRYTTLIENIAAIDARLSISAKEGINLVQYSDKMAIAKERRHLMEGLDKVKTDTMRALGGFKRDELLALGFTDEEVIEAAKAGRPGKELFNLHYEVSEEAAEGAYSALYQAESEIREDMEIKDRLFKKIRRTEVSKAVFKGTIIGAGVGLAASEIVDAATGGYGVIDAAQGQSASVENTEYDFDLSGKIQEFNATEHTQFTFPSEFDAQFHDGAMDVTGPNGFTMDSLYFNEDGTLTDHSREILESRGFSGMDNPIHETLVQETSKPDVVNAQQLLENHKGETTQITREAWNEPTDQQLQYGGIGDTGLDKDGNIVISAESMIGTSDAAREAMQNGDMHLLLSASEGTQSTVVPVEFNSSGVAVIDKDSLGASMFDTSHGHAEFTGKYMEAASSQGVDANGIAHVEVFATAEGEGHQIFSDVTTVKEAEKLTHYTLSYDGGHDTVTETVPTITDEIADSLENPNALTLTYRSRTALQASEPIPATAGAATSELPEAPPTPVTPPARIAPVTPPGPTPPVAPAPAPAPRRPLGPGPTGPTPAGPAPSTFGPLPTFGPVSPVGPLAPSPAPGPSTSPEAAATSAALPIPGVGPTAPEAGSPNPVAPPSPEANPAARPDQPTPAKIENWMANNESARVPYTFNMSLNRYENISGDPVERSGLDMFNAVRTYIDDLTSEANDNAKLSEQLAKSTEVAAKWGHNEAGEIVQMSQDVRLSIGLVSTSDGDIEGLVNKYLSQGGFTGDNSLDSYELNLMVAKFESGFLAESPETILAMNQKIARAQAAAQAAGVRLNVSTVATDLEPTMFINTEGKSIFLDALMKHAESRPYPNASAPVYAVFDDGKVTGSVPANYVQSVISQMDQNPQLEYVRPHRLLEDNRVNQFVNFSYLVGDSVEGLLPEISAQSPATNSGLAAGLQTDLNSGVFALEGLARVRGLHDNGLGAGELSLGAKLTALHGNDGAPNLSAVELWPDDPAVAVVVSDQKAFKHAADLLIGNDSSIAQDVKNKIASGLMDAKELIQNWGAGVDLTELVPTEASNVQEFSKVLNRVFGQLKGYATESGAQAAMQAVLTNTFPGLAPADISIDMGGAMVLSQSGWEAVAQRLDRDSNEAFDATAARAAAAGAVRTPVPQTPTPAGPALPTSPAPTPPAVAPVSPENTAPAPSSEPAEPTEPEQRRQPRPRQSFEVGGHTLTQRQEFGVTNMVFSGAEETPYTGRVRFLNLSRGRSGRPAGNLLFLPINENGQVTDIKGEVIPQGQRARPYSIPPERVDEIFGTVPAPLSFAPGSANDPWRDVE